MAGRIDAQEDGFHRVAWIRAIGADLQTMLAAGGGCGRDGQTVVGAGCQGFRGESELILGETRQAGDGEGLACATFYLDGFGCGRFSGFPNQLLRGKFDVGRDGGFDHEFDGLLVTNEPNMQ
jgi:hypothetical protein